MKDGLWRRLQKKFGLFFVIGAALSFANAVSSLQLLVDVWEFVLESVRNVKGVVDFLNFLSYAVHAILAWWRSIIYTFFEWFDWRPHVLLLDLGSALFFTVGRAIQRYLALTAELNDLERQIANNERKREEQKNAERGLANAYHGMELESLDDPDSDAIPHLVERADYFQRLIMLEIPKITANRGRIPRQVALTLAVFSIAFGFLYTVDWYYVHTVTKAKDHKLTMGWTATANRCVSVHSLVFK